MNAAIHVIGVDIGTQSTKAVLVRADGHIVAQASINYQVETPKPLWAQQWPGVWLYAVAASICGVLAEAGVDAASVKSLCVSSLYGGSIDPHALLERDAAPLPLGADGLLFLPYLMGECSPVWDAQASGCFIGLGLHHGRAHLYRAVLEGVSMALRHNIEAGVRGVAKLDDHLVVVGGASHSDLWMQIIADVTGRPVHTITEDVEASLGAAMLAALGVGLIDDDAVRRGWVQPVRRALPNAGSRPAYDALFDHYQAAYPALKPLMHGLRRQPVAVP